jgi:hypothetical protein
MAKSWKQLGVHSDFFDWLDARAERKGKSKAAELISIMATVQQVEGEQPVTVAAPASAAVRE